MKNKQGFSSIALAVIILLVLGGGYWLWQSRDGSPTSITAVIDKANWQTYRNEEYGFEIKYPGNWNRCSGIYPDGFLCVKDPRSEFGSDKLELFLPKQDGVDIEQIRVNLDKNKTQFGLPVVKKQINGLDFVLAGGCDAGCDHHSLVFLKNGKLLEISYTADGEVSITKDQILSTFRFTE